MLTISDSLNQRMEEVIENYQSENVINLAKNNNDGCMCCNGACIGDCVNGCYSSCQGDGRAYW